MWKNIQITNTNSFIQLTQPGKYQIDLVKPYSSVEIFGSFEVFENEHFSIEVIINHLTHHTQSNTVIKSVGYNNSSIIIRGAIGVAVDSYASQSFLEERVLLVGEKSQATVIPELEICNNHVVCSHKASVSKLPSKELFYLQSRGLSLTDATALLTKSFLDIKRKWSSLTSIEIQPSPG